MGSQYMLRSELRGHDEDVSCLDHQGEDSVHANVNTEISNYQLQVRSLLVCDLGLLTGSRDKTIKLWKNVADGYEVDNTYVGHESYVTALQYVPTGLLANFPAGAIVSGTEWPPGASQLHVSAA